MEQVEDVVSLAPAPVFVDDTGRRRRASRRVGRVLLLGFTAYLGLVVMGFARDPHLGPLQLPTIGLPDLGLMIPPDPLILGEETTRRPSAADIEVSTAASDGDVVQSPPSGGRPAPSSGRGTETPGHSSPPSGVSPAPGLAPTGIPAGSGTTTTSTSTTTTTRPRGNSPTSSTTTTATTAPAEPSTAAPTTPGQGPVSAKGPDGSGPPGYGNEAPGQQRKTTPGTGS